jgi:uncharacterized integral membrane protein (TIGR00698 family)
VILGLNLSLGQVASIGAGSLPVLVGTLVAALTMAKLVGGRLGLSPNLTALIGVGTAICGASAIAAADAVIDADEPDVSYSVTTIFLFNVAAVLAYPSLGHLLGLSQHAFGLFAGTAVNDTSSVVAASSAYGHQALQYGVVVKLTRTLAIVPVCAGLAWWQARRRSLTPTDPALGARPQAGLRSILPRFMVWFLAAVTLNSGGLVPARFHADLSTLAMWSITVALAAIGLSTELGPIRRTGPRPLLLGAILWLTVGLSSLLLQGATGTV